MATKPRVWLSGGIYHITVRGNRKGLIFLEEHDYYVYLSILKNTLEFYEEYNYKIVAYCLMSNHVHLLIKTDKKDPSFFMRRINSMYAKYFNDKYDFVGHLFQERYFSNAITSIIELLEVCRYIHLNPVRANITTRPEEYKWSSYNKTISRNVDINSNVEINEKELYIAVEEILDIFDIYLIVEENNIKNIKESIKENIKDTRAKYREYVEEKI